MTPAVLVVDDREENLVAVEAALQPLKYRVVRASSGEEALRQLLLDDFALIVLDVQMPGIDGFETARAIKGRDRTKNVPILFLTAINRDDDNRLAGYETGAVDYLFKPVSPELLRAKVAVFVELHVKQVELERKTDELERSNRDLEQFSYVASHDLQEPLRVVAGYLELLADHCAGSAEGEALEWVRRAQVTTTRMAGLVADLLAFARAGADPPAPVAVDLGHAVRAAADHLAVACRESGAQISVLGDLPPVAALEREVVQVVQNVIANSIRYGGAVTVKVSASRRDDAMIEVLITDDGPGVAPEEMERVFGLFERIEDSPYPGTGLGLAICRRTVEQRGGHIWMGPNPDGRGVAVHATWPAVES